MASAFFLLRHFFIETRHIHCHIVFADCFFYELQRETVGIVKLECCAACENVAGFHLIQLFCQYRHASRKCAAKSFFLTLYHLPHEAVIVGQVGVFAVHHCHDFVHHLGAGHSLNTEHMSMTNGSAHDAAQHIAPVFVGREHAVRDQKSHSPGVFCQNAQGEVFLRVFAV